MPLKLGLVLILEGVGNVNGLTRGEGLLVLLELVFVGTLKIEVLLGALKLTAALKLVLLMLFCGVSFLTLMFFLV